MQDVEHQHINLQAQEDQTLRADLLALQEALEVKERRVTRLLWCATATLLSCPLFVMFMWMSGPTQLQCAKIVSPYCKFFAQRILRTHMLTHRLVKLQYGKL